MAALQISETKHNISVIASRFRTGFTKPFWTKYQWNHNSYNHLWRQRTVVFQMLQNWCQQWKMQHALSITVHCRLQFTVTRCNCRSHIRNHEVSLMITRCRNLIPQTVVLLLLFVVVAPHAVTQNQQQQILLHLRYCYTVSRKTRNLS